MYSVCPCIDESKVLVYGSYHDRLEGMGLSCSNYYKGKSGGSSCKNKKNVDVIIQVKVVEVIAQWKM